MTPDASADLPAMIWGWLAALVLISAGFGVQRVAAWRRRRQDAKQLAEREALARVLEPPGGRWKR